MHEYIYRPSPSVRDVDIISIVDSWPILRHIRLGHLENKKAQLTQRERATAVHV